MYNYVYEYECGAAPDGPPPVAIDAPPRDKPVGPAGECARTSGAARHGGVQATSAHSR